MPRIGDNIRFGRPDGDRMPKCWPRRAPPTSTNSSSQFPDGYETEVGAAGTFGCRAVSASAMTIARALLKDPAILIFDEATSSLDSKSERHVQDAIENLLGGRTVFLIAHRLSTVQNADKILVLERGTVTQSGTHEQLANTEGLYRDLIRMQAR